MHDFFGLVRLVVILFFIVLFIGLCRTDTNPAEASNEIPSSAEFCPITESL